MTSRRPVHVWAELARSALEFPVARLGRLAASFLWCRGGVGHLLMGMGSPARGPGMKQGSTTLLRGGSRVPPRRAPRVQRASVASMVSLRAAWVCAELEWSLLGGSVCHCASTMRPLCGDRGATASKNGWPGRRDAPQSSAPRVPGEDDGYARASRSDTSRLRLTCCSAASRTRRRWTSAGTRTTNLPE
jgi:hypothetical protein